MAEILTKSRARNIFYRGSLFYPMRFGSGVAVVLGALDFIYAIAFPRREITLPSVTLPVRGEQA